MDTLTQTLHMLSRVKRYTAWQYRAIQPYIGKRILEVGCGIGVLTKLLRSNGFVVAMDCDEDYIKVIKSQFCDNNDVITIIGDICNKEILDVAKYNFDTVICMNVLEHIEDDAGALRNMYSILQKNGKLIVLVPAIPFFYGAIDKNLGHFRRYMKKDLQKKMSSCGFKIEKNFYFNLIGAIGWFISSRVLNKKIIPENQAMCVEKLTPILSLSESLFKPPLGLSVIAIGSK